MKDTGMRVSDFDYRLPEELIAQHPKDRRDGSRLIIVDRETGRTEHRHFYDILDQLSPSDCLVLNDSKVIPARLFGIKEGTGAKVEFLLLKRIEGDVFEVMVKPGRKLKTGDVVTFSGPDDDAGSVKAEITGYGSDGIRKALFSYEGIFMEKLEKLGKMPLPPYIKRDAENEDKERYQTVYCKREGSVAAPTAGLHFTRDLLKKVSDKGVKLAYLTLHVGIGTFRPVKEEKVTDHHMHFEDYQIDEETAEIINSTIESGGRIISVGTTSVRTLESAAQKTDGKWKIRAGTGSTDIFIYPGYSFKIVDSLITNFHLPRSTLLMLVSALYTREDMLGIYREAVEKEYRFFSYGDAMFIK